MKAVTANRLDDGAVVWRAPGGAWTLTLSEAEVFESDDAAKQALAEAIAQPQQVVGAYLIDMVGPLSPSGDKGWKEQIRARGPTVRHDLGKQAEGL